MNTKKELYQIEDLNKKSIDGLIIIDVTNSNPNGDPDMGGKPRMNIDGEGIISHVSVKRKIRDLIQNPQNLDVLVKNISDSSGIPVTTGFGSEILESHEAKGKACENIRDLANTPVKELTDRFIDMRLFGCTLLTSNESKNSEEGSTEGQEGEQQENPTKKNKKEKKQKVENNVIFTGPIQFVPAKSICKIDVTTQTTTKKVGVTEGKDRGMAPDAMSFVNHGLYIMKFNYRPNQGEKVNTTNDDLRIFLETLPSIFNGTSLNRSSVNIKEVIVGVHNSRIGSFNAFDFYNKITPKAKEGVVTSKSAEDYIYPDLHESVKGLEGKFFSYNI